MNLVTNADGDLARRAIEGDQAAWLEIWTSCRLTAYRVASAILTSREEREEAVQETFVRLWRYRRDYDPELGSLKSYVATIARRVCFDTLGRLRKLGRIEDAMLMAMAEAVERPVPEDLLDALRVHLASCIPDDLGRKIMDLYMRGRRNMEIAETLGIRQGTVSGYISRIVGCLRGKMKRNQR